MDLQTRLIALGPGFALLEDMAPNDVVIAQLLAENRHLRRVVGSLHTSAGTRHKLATPREGGVTKGTEVEEALQASEERFHRLFMNDLTGDCLSTPDGQILLCNPAFAEMFGYATLPEALGTNVVALYLDRRERTPLLERLRRERKIDRLEVWRKRCDGEPIHIVENLVGHFDERGELCEIQGYLFEDTQHKRAEESLRVHRQQLRLLASELTLAEERERRCIAADLHDHVCQDLFQARMRLQPLLEDSCRTGGPAPQQIDTILGAVLEKLRDLTFDLSSPTLYRFGLEAALEELLDDKLRRELGLECHFHDDSQAKPLSDNLRVLLFRSVRELLINIAKHARARRVDLEVRRVNDCIEIAVADDGTGCDVQAVLAPTAHHQHFGLLSIRERLEHVRGNLEIHSQLGQGSRFTLVAPLDMKIGNTGRNSDGRQDSIGG